MNYGEKLKMLRISKKINQADMAEYLGITLINKYNNELNEKIIQKTSLNV